MWNTHLNKYFIFVSYVVHMFCHMYLIVIAYFCPATETPPFTTDMIANYWNLFAMIAIRPHLKWLQVDIIWNDLNWIANNPHSKWLPITLMSKCRANCLRMKFGDFRSAPANVCVWNSSQRLWMASCGMRGHVFLRHFPTCVHNTKPCKKHQNTSLMGPLYRIGNYIHCSGIKDWHPPIHHTTQYPPVSFKN